MSGPPAFMTPGRKTPDGAKQKIQAARNVQHLMGSGHVNKPRRNEVGNTWMDDLGNFHDKYTHMFVRNPNRTSLTREEVRAAKRAAKQEKEKRKT